LEHDIRLCCVPAKSFPEGVMAAFQQIMNTSRQQGSRRLFGVSWPDGQGSLVYKAAIEEAIEARRKNWIGNLFVRRENTSVWWSTTSWKTSLPSARPFAGSSTLPAYTRTPSAWRNMSAARTSAVWSPCSWKQSLPEINNLAAGLTGLPIFYE